MPSDAGGTLSKPVKLSYDSLACYIYLLIPVANFDLFGNPMEYIMIVEDQALVASLLKHKITEIDTRPVEVFQTEVSALKRSEIDAPQMAFLDVNLGDHTSFGLARRLLTLGAKIFFITSYSATSIRTVGACADLATVEVVAKELILQELPRILKSA